MKSTDKGKKKRRKDIQKRKPVKNLSDVFHRDRYPRVVHEVPGPQKKKKKKKKKKKQPTKKLSRSAASSKVGQKKLIV